MGNIDPGVLEHQVSDLSHMYTKHKLSEETDTILGQYYANCGRNDYFDDKGIGKFMGFVKRHANTIDLELFKLRNDMNSNDSVFIQMDPTFPWISGTTHTNQLRIDINRIGRKFAIKKSLDSLNSIYRLLTLSQFHRDDFVLTWQHIANALNHELYDKISSSFMTIVNGNKKFENVDELLEEIQNETHIHQNETNYIQQLLERAEQFHNYVGMSLHTCTSSPKPQDKRFTIRMSDIIETIHNSDDAMMLHHVMRYMNDNEYNTEKTIVDLNKAIVDANKKISLSPDAMGYDHVKRMKNIPFVDVEFARNFMKNVHHDSDWNTKEVCIVNPEDNDSKLLNTTKLKEFLNCEECHHECKIYDLDGVFCGDASQTIRERYHDEWKRNTKDMINAIWVSDWRSNTSYFRSDLLRMKLLHSSERIDPQCDELNFMLLHDICSAHQCFLFGNYHFKQYHQFAGDIQTCKHLNQNIKQCAKQTKLEYMTMDFYPYYIIDDDMYSVCKYFFCASQIVHNKQMQN
eukprot:164177_1